jgi:hypothetical protein
LDLTAPESNKIQYLLVYILLPKPLHKIDSRPEFGKVRVAGCRGWQGVGDRRQVLQADHGSRQRPVNP